MPYDPTLVSYFGLTFFAFAFSFYGIKQPGIFNELYAERRDASKKVVLRDPNIKYERSGLKETDAEKYLTRLLRYMEAKKPYLDVDLTIQDVAKSLNISRHYLTQVINERLNRNFYQFINEYRIEEVKRLLEDENYKKYTLTAIAFEAGFNSKSSFNSAFKEIAGMTPSEYREKQNI